MPAVPVFCSMMHSCRVRFGLVLAALVLAGCATAPSRTEGPDPWRSLAANMTADQVRTLLGQPAAVRPMVSSQGPAEIWTYRRTVSKEVDLVAARTQEMPVMNPLTGQQGTMPVAEYSQESRTVTEELQLLLFDGKLVSWKCGYRTDRSYL
jgi:hypothetical protein